MDFEIKLIEFLQAGRTPFFDVSFQVISAIGSILGVIFACVVFLIFNRKLCFWYLFSYGFVYLLINIIKHFVERARPFNAVDTIQNIGDTVTDFSFPSGHAACATAIAIFVGYLLLKHYKQKGVRVGIILSCSLYVGLVCLSRMYLGKHYLTDVVAGVVISVVVCVIGLVVMNFLEKKVIRNENKNGSSKS